LRSVGLPGSKDDNLSPLHIACIPNKLTDSILMDRCSGRKIFLKGAVDKVDSICSRLAEKATALQEETTHISASELRICRQRSQ